MANLLESRGQKTFAAGMLNSSISTLDRLCNAAESIVVVNKANVDREFQTDTTDKHARQILNVLDKYKEKISTCDTVGFDRWGVPMHPELVERCNLYIDSPLEKERLLEEIRARYKKGE